MDKKVVVPIHSAVSLSYKKNTFESILMRWMKLDPIIQLSQKYKHQYSILIYIYIYGIYKDGNDYAISV